MPERFEKTPLVKKVPLKFETEKRPALIRSLGAYILIFASSTKSITLQQNCIRNAFSEVSKIWYCVKIPWRKMVIHQLF